MSITRWHCISCERRLAQERAVDGSDPQVCTECRKTGLFATNTTSHGIPLADDNDMKEDR